jgi:large subunit ribosomal protein L3
MPNIRAPRHGSMQFWPRKRARRAFARVRSWPKKAEAVPLGFAGYKVGMTNIMVMDSRKHSMTKGEEINVPVTIIECPPMRVASIRLYKRDPTGLKLAGEIVGKVEKELGRTIPLPKKTGSAENLNPQDYVDIRLNVYTQPSLTGIGKKKPELFEIGIGGSIEQKLAYAKENLGKEIFLSSVFAEGQQVDLYGVTRGKGFQGPVKRFGVAIRQHKAEKTKRGPGSLGGWRGQGHVMYRVAHAGQMGYHIRKEWNKHIIKISDKAEEINPKGGFVRYGVVKNQYMLVKGSVQGPAKRMIRMIVATRPNHKIPAEKVQVTYVNLESKQ